MPRLSLSSRERARRIGRRIERPPAHWSLLALVLFALLLLLFTQAVAEHLTGASATPPAKGDSVLRRGQTILTVRGDRLVSAGQPPGRRIALTFDDGPDPKWTPRVADALAQLG